MLAEQQVKLEATQEGMEALVEVGHMHTMLGPAPTQQPERGRRKVTKTELHHAEVLKGLGISDRFPKVARRERREFTAEEDHRLLQGFQIVCVRPHRIASVGNTANSLAYPVRSVLEQNPGRSCATSRSSTKHGSARSVWFLSSFVRSVLFGSPIYLIGDVG